MIDFNDLKYKIYLNIYMKLAFCLYGLSGNYSENGAHLRLNRGCAHTFEIMKYSFESYKKNFYDVNKDFTIDTYFHTRNHKNIDKIIDLYKPKKYIVQEKLTNCPKNNHIHAYSKLESQKKVLSLLDQDYDVVFLCRFDLDFIKPFKICEENIKKNVICFPKSHHKIFNGKILQHRYFYNTPSSVKENITIKYNDKNKYACDWWFIFSGVDTGKIIKMIDNQISVGTNKKNVHIFPSEYFCKEKFDTKYSKISFYDTPLTRIKFGIYT